MIPKGCKFGLLLVATFALCSESSVSSIEIIITGPRIVPEGSDAAFTCAISPSIGPYNAVMRWYFLNDVFHQNINTRGNENTLDVSGGNGSLTIRNVTKYDAGTYMCCLTQNECANAWLYVLSIGTDTRFVHHKRNATSEVTVRQNVQFSITIYHGRVKAYTERNPERQFCDHFSNYGACSSDQDEHRTMYTVRNASMHGSGWFTLKDDCSGNISETIYRLGIFIQGLPEVKLDNMVALWNADHVEVVCSGHAYPYPSVLCWVEKCVENTTTQPLCFATLPVAHFMFTNVENFTHSIEFSRKFNATGPFDSHHVVSCSVFNAEGTANLVAYLFLRNFHEQVRMTVTFVREAAVPHRHTVKLDCQAEVYNFTNEFIFQSNAKDCQVFGHKDRFAWYASFEMIVDHPRGTVSCRVRHRNGSYVEVSEELTIDSSDLYFVRGNTSTSIALHPGETALLHCDARGAPLREIRWVKNGILLNHNDSMHFASVSSDEESATFECTAISRQKQISKSWRIQQKRSDDGRWRAIVEAALGAVVLLSLGVIWFALYRTKKPTESIYEYPLEYISNVLPIMVPPEYEFAREKLFFLETIGEGEYGVVMKARAENIFVTEPETLVAVKMVKHTSSASVLHVLVAELKMLFHIGQHLNVVNFLGAVTINANSRDLMIIFEYCQYGSLQDFLRKYKASFVECSLEPAEGQHGQQPQPSAITDPRSCFKTTDLVCWAAQVAHGMAYLVSQDVLHGDLAARNVLLGDRNVVKISDFGLSRKVQRGSCYRKKGNDRLPLKWLALECIAEQVFSVQTDVWAYGVLLWEIFSLGTVPYPGVDTVGDLYKMLCDGYRMEMPHCANEEIYGIMLSCWFVNPALRPLFDKLASLFNAMLPKELRNRYIILNEPYVQANSLREQRISHTFTSEPGSPDADAPPIPTFDQRLSDVLP